MKLKTKLIAMNSLVLFFIGVMMLLQFRAAQNKQKFEIRKSFIQSADKLSRQVSNAFYMYYHNVQNVSLNKTLHDKDFESSNFYFNEVVSLYPMYKGIIFVDADGNYISSNSLDASGNKIDVSKLKSANYKNMKWFSGIKSGKFTEDLKKKIYGTRVDDFQKSDLFSAAYGKDVMGNYFTSVVSDEFGDALGYVTTFVDEKWLENELLASNKDLEAEDKKGADIYLINSKGIVISEVDAGKIKRTDLLSKNVETEYASDIKKSMSLKDPTFIEAMLSFNSEPLVAFTEFDNDKFVTALGWKAFVKVNSEGAFAAISLASNVFLISFIITLIIGSMIAFIVSTKLSDRLLNVASSVFDGSKRISDAATSLSNQSQQLSRGTSSQASGLQQTVASLNEISAMVNKNTDASQSSKELSNQSRSAAEKGKERVRNMIGSIDEISESNADILNQMTTNAEEIQGIISVIKEIEDKTKVINDIVFQTKLLSFNASVEAARAGENGKGFAVVAEEVGNLAQHSGDAASQIEEMLTESVNKVEAIAKNSATTVEALVKKGTEKIERGKGTARECGSALDEILEQANNLDSMIEEISIASVEQSQGIQEISRAMQELDTVTKQNSEIASQTNKDSTLLNNQVDNLKDISSSLTFMITGEGEIKKPVQVVKEKAPVKKKEVKAKEKAKAKKVEKAKAKKVEKVAKPNFKAAAKKVEKVEKKAPVKEEATVLSFEKKEVKSSAPVVETKVAANDNAEIVFPDSGDGEWEDI